MGAHDDDAVNFAAGAIAGVVEAVAVQPLDMVKTRFQLMAGEGIPRPPVLVALKDLIREGGVARLYRGLLPELTCLPHTRAVMFAAYESALRPLTQVNGGRDSAIVHGAAGFAAGIPEAVAITPFQVVKVRLQARGEHRHSIA